MTYDEAAAALGRSHDAVRQLARRRRWRRVIGNDGLARIGVPDDYSDPPRPLDVPRTTSPERPGDVRPNATDMLVAELRDRLAEMQTRLAAVDAERVGLRQEIVQERATAAQERERLQAALVDAGHRLDRLQAARDADQQEHRRQADELRQLLDKAQRPWWRRGWAA